MKQLTPRQGTKISHCTRFSSTTNETTHTPPGDENQYLMISVTRSFETTHTPSGDENQTFATKHHVICFEITYTPSGDENHFRTLYGYNAVRIETTYAPPGDENSS